MEKIETHNPDIEQALNALDRLVDWDTSLTSRNDFEALLNSGKQLRIKFGADITAQTLHIGHGVNLRAMRVLQDLGHKVVFLLGGFTTLVGDPTDRLQARSKTGQEEIEKNKKGFLRQVKMILRDDSEVWEEHDNTTWWGDMEHHGTLNLAGILERFKSTTYSTLVNREMFKRRIASDLPIYMSEFMYPLFQGYDSVELDSDLTIVGSDQMYNEMQAWPFQVAAGQQKQAILTTKITQGLDGEGKQSKSVGNYVGLEHSPEEKYARTMLLHEDHLVEWFKVYTEISDVEIEEIERAYTEDPEKYKHILAYEIVRIYHGEDSANAASQAYLDGDVKLSLDDILVKQKEAPKSLSGLRDLGVERTTSIESVDTNERLVEYLGRYLDIDPDAQAALCKKLETGEKLNIKLQFDIKDIVTFQDIPKLLLAAALQKQGHQVVVVFDDFYHGETGVSYPVNELKMILEKYLDPSDLLYRSNSEWLGDAKTYSEKTFGQLLELFSGCTLGAVLQYRDYIERAQSDKNPLYLNDLLKPLLSAVDSVVVQPDIIIGRSDESVPVVLLKTMIVEEDQPVFLQTKKMIIDSSKPKEDAQQVSLLSSPEKMFEGINYLPDSMVEGFFEIYSSISPQKLEDIRALNMGNNGVVDPVKLKHELAVHILASIYGIEKAEDARKTYLAQRSQLEVPTEMPEIEFASGQTLLDILALAYSGRENKSVLRDALKNGGIKYVVSKGENKVLAACDLTTSPNNGMIIKKGKKDWFKLTSK